MKNFLKRLPGSAQRLLFYAGKVAGEQNMPICLVGGIVRDLILGVVNLDLDLVVEGEGINFAEILAGRLKAKVVRHRRFSTATLILPSGAKIDIATARSEYYPYPAHLPVVSPGTIKDDLKRRDFTVNAMALSIAREDFGSLIDFFGGREDLRKRRIRILHSRSFIDDPTRILRAVRFEQRYGFSIEPGTLNALKNSIKLGMLNKVEPQRIRDDLILMLKEKEPLKEVRRLKRLAGFSFINKHLAVDKKTFLLLSSAAKEISAFRRKFPRRRPLDSWLIYFMCLIDSLSITQAERVCQKFAFRRGEIKRIISLKKISGAFLRKLASRQLSPAEIFNMLEPLSYETTLVLKAKYRRRRIEKRVNDFFEIYNGMRLCVKGDDLCRIGVEPGPFYREVFQRVLQAKLNGLVKTRGEELAMIKKLCRR